MSVVSCVKNAALLFGFLFPVVALGAEISGWSFKTHPHPHLSDMTQQEMDLRFQTKFDGTSLSVSCNETLEVEFGIYNRRFSGFDQFGDADQRFLAWKYHIVSDDMSFVVCATHHAVFEIAAIQDEIGKTGLMFCGKFSREPVSPLERKFVQLIEEMLSYALLGSPDAYESFTYVSEFQGLIDLNPDVEFFLREGLRRAEIFKAEWDTSHLVDQLTPQRRQFLDKAIEADDFAAVLETTAPCQ